MEMTEDGIVAPEKAGTMPEPPEQKKAVQPRQVANIWWVASYPKSGNTWMRAFLTAYEAGKTDFVTGMLGTQDVSPPWNNFASPIPGKKMAVWEQYALRPGALLYMREHLSPTKRLWIKTHNCVGEVEGYYLIPPMLCDGAVYIVRDPRSVVASWARHMGSRLDGTLAELRDHTRQMVQQLARLAGKAVDQAEHMGMDIDGDVRPMVEEAGNIGVGLEEAADTLTERVGETGYDLKSAAKEVMDTGRMLNKDGFWQYVSSWQRNVRSWLANAEVLNACVIRYEDLVNEPYATFTKVVRHCYGEVDSERLKMAIEATDFERMKRQEAEQGFEEASKKAERFFRRGSTDWTQEVDDEVARMLEDEFGDTMAELGYLGEQEKAA